MNAGQRGDALLSWTIAALALLVMAAPVQAEPFTCTIERKFHCSSEGCAAVAPGTAYNRIDFERGTYARCDAKGCEEHPATFSRSGAFVTGIFGSGGAMAKLSLLDGGLLEVATLWLEAWISYGTCAEDRP